MLIQTEQHGRHRGKKNWLMPIDCVEQIVRFRLRDRQISPGYETTKL